MGEYIITYKVVRHDRYGYLWSAIVDHPLLRSYAKDTWTIADINGLLSFSLFEYARTFALRNSVNHNLEIWKAQAKEPVALGACAYDPSSIGIDWAAELWAGKISNRSDWPEGTVAHKQLRLLERLWPEANPTKSEEIV